jgi:hypothetical protein
MTLRAHTIFENQQAHFTVGSVAPRNSSRSQSYDCCAPLRLVFCSQYDVARSHYFSKSASPFYGLLRGTEELSARHLLLIGVGDCILHRKRALPHDLLVSNRIFGVFRWVGVKKSDTHEKSFLEDDDDEFSINKNLLGIEVSDRCRGGRLPVDLSVGNSRCGRFVYWCHEIEMI